MVISRRRTGKNGCATNERWMGTDRRCAHQQPERLCYSDAIEEEGGAEFGGVVGAVALGVVEGGEIDFAGGHGGSGEGGVGVTAVLNAYHGAGGTFPEHVHPVVGERNGRGLVDGGALAPAE